MCQVLILTNVSKVKDRKKLITSACEEITKHDADGFGYAFNGSNGVFGEKSLNGDMYRHYEYGYNSVATKFIKSSSQFFGVKGDLTGAALFHGRTSTNQINLPNTHPMQKRGWTLIHNGVVTNNGPKYTPETSNDTEHILEYLTTTGMSGVEKYLSGYYAFGAIDPDGKLHVVRDNRAGLHTAYINEIDSWVFGTTKELIYNVCIDMKWTYTRIDEYSENMYTVWDKNEMLECRPIDPLGWSALEQKHAAQSLHYLTPQEDTFDLTDRGIFDVSNSGARFNDVGDTPDLKKYLSSTEYALESRKAFFDELRYADASYEIYGPDRIPITLQELRKLSEIDQMQCTIYRSDGTLMDHEDYFESKYA